MFSIKGGRPAFICKGPANSMAFAEPSARCGHVSAKIGAKVYMWGGTGSSPGNTSHLNRVAIYFQ